MQFMRDTMPAGNRLPKNIYQAKKIVADVPRTSIPLLGAASNGMHRLDGTDFFAEINRFLNGNCHNDTSRLLIKEL